MSSVILRHAPLRQTLPVLFNQVTALALSPAAPETLYAAIPLLGVAVSRDGGRHWSLNQQRGLGARFSFFRPGLSGLDGRRLGRTCQEGSFFFGSSRTSLPVGCARTRGGRGDGGRDSCLREARRLLPGAAVRPGAERGRAGASALRLAATCDPRRLRRHDRQRQDRACASRCSKRRRSTASRRSSSIPRATSPTCC